MKRELSGAGAFSCPFRPDSWGESLKTALLKVGFRDLKVREESVNDRSHFGSESFCMR